MDRIPLRARAATAHRRHRCARAAGLALLLAAAVVAAAAPPAAGPAWLDLRINGRLQPEPVRVERLADGGLALPAARVAALGLREGLLPRVSTASGPGYRIVPPLVARIDESTQTLALEIPATAYGQTVIDHPSASAPELPAALAGAYLDYDLLAESVGGERDGRGFFEAIAFGDRGVLGNSFTWSDTGDTGTSAHRIETWWADERPQTMTSLRLGDATSRPVPWGSALRYGGVQWRRDFGTRPGFDIHPTPVLTGSTALPSVVDVYVDNVRRERLDVPAGPFELRNLPLPATDGTVTLVVTDVLGRQQVITTAYAGSTDLLRPGLTDFALQLGRRREALGSDSDDYGAPLMTAHVRRGLTDAWTLGAAAEADETVRSAGLGTDFRLGGFGTLGLDAALSDGDAGTGRFAGLRYRHRLGRWRFGGAGELRSPAFRAVAETLEAPRRREQWRAFAGVDLGRFGGLAASVLDRSGYGADNLRRATLSHRLTLPRGFALATAASRSHGDRDDSFLGLTLSWIPGARTHVSAGAVERSSAPDERRLTLAGRAGDDAAPIAYRVSAIDESRDRLDVAADRRGPNARVAARLVAEAERTAGRVGLQGSLGVVDGVPFAGRSVGRGGLALVQAGDAPGVDVLLENRPAARTGAAGAVVVTGLRPYEQNRIALDGADLPLAVTPVALETTALPRRRRAVAVDFGLRSAVPVHVTLLDAAGEPLPAGTEATAPGTNAAFPVGLDGRAFVDLAAVPGGRLVARNDGIACAYTLPAAAATEPFTDLGALSCHRP